MINCSIRYGAGYNDYNIFEYYNMNAKQRKTFMTRLKNKGYIKTNKVGRHTYYEPIIKKTDYKKSIICASIN